MSAENAEIVLDFTMTFDEIDGVLDLYLQPVLLISPSSRSLEP